MQQPLFHAAIPQRREWRSPAECLGSAAGRSADFVVSAGANTDRRAYSLPVWE
jgi:hypothetical protein